MIAFYNLTTTIKDQLELDPFVKTVTLGDIFDIDLNKQTIFPLSHIVVNNVTHEASTLLFNISIFAMDIVDISKEVTSDQFIGNDNTHDVLNTQLAVLSRLTERLRRGDLFEEGYMLEGSVNYEAFTERFENNLAGWVGTYDIRLGHDMTVC